MASSKPLLERCNFGIKKMFNIPSFQAIEIKGYVKFFEKGGPFSIVHGTPCVFFCRLDLH